MCRLDDYRYENFTRAFLNGCGRLAKLPEQSLLLHAREPQGQLRDLVAQNDDAARGLPTIATGQGPVFTLAPGASPVEAIQYVDGDSGHIVTQFFPGLFVNKVCVRPLSVWIGTSTTCCPFESSTTMPSNSATSTWWSPRRQTEVPAKRTDRVIYLSATMPLSLPGGT